MLALIAALDPLARADSKNQYGGQDRADAASAMIVQAVQQGISSLPPSEAQSLTYDVDEAGNYVASERLGPTALWSPETLPAGRLSVRAAASYFELSRTFDPIIYQLTVPPNGQIPEKGWAELGMSAKANVTLINFAATYGITNRIEVSVNVPVTIVQAQAKQSYTVVPADLMAPARDRQLGVVQALPGDTPEIIRQAVADNLKFAESSFSSLGFDFNDGTHAGVGRIGAGAKMRIYDSKPVEIALAPEFFCNSPNQNQFSGSNSPALLARAIGQVNAAKLFPAFEHRLRWAKDLHLYSDVGYEHDFQVSELSRFVWDAGISLPLAGWTLDLGVGGSKFDTPIRWTPVTATGVGPTAPPQYPDGLPGTLTALDPNATQLGTNYVNFLSGIKVRLFDFVLSGAVTVPVTSDGFQPAAIGTLALEYYFGSTPKPSRQSAQGSAK